MPEERDCFAVVFPFPLIAHNSFYQTSHITFSWNDEQEFSDQARTHRLSLSLQ